MFTVIRCDFVTILQNVRLLCLELNEAVFYIADQKHNTLLLIAAGKSVILECLLELFVKNRFNGMK